MEEIYRTIIEEGPDAVVYADRDGIIRLWNHGAERIFGFSAAAAVGRSLDLIIPERQRARHWEGYRRVMATGQTRYGTALLAVPALNQAGEQLSSEFSIVMLRAEDGSPRGIASLLRDVSARWQREIALRERLAALEKRADAATPPPT